MNLTCSIPGRPAPQQLNEMLDQMLFKIVRGFKTIILKTRDNKVIRKKTSVIKTAANFSAKFG